MEFRNPETGEVFENTCDDVTFCGHYKGCIGCPIGDAKQNYDCTYWINHHPHEAARMMGYEVVEDEPVGNFDQLKEEANMDKPRICEVLGIEAGEHFYIDGFKGEYHVNSDGVLKWGGQTSCDAIYEAINHPDRIIRKPRWTEQEVDMATLLIDFRGSGSVTVGRQVNGPLWWRGENDEHGLLPREFFPSLRPGETIKLDEIIGGTE